jgi:chromosome condensin MukBEF MukE localization factor
MEYNTTKNYKTQVRTLNVTACVFRELLNTQDDLQLAKLLKRISAKTDLDTPTIREWIYHMNNKNMLKLRRLGKFIYLEKAITDDEMQNFILFVEKYIL